MSTPVARVPLTFGRIVIIGGGCYGSWYAQQLTRAARAGAIHADEVVVVDRDPACRVATMLHEGHYDGLPVHLAVAQWDDYVASWLGQEGRALSSDTMVPSPLMPHLCLD